MHMFYQTYPIRNALRSELSWTHYRTLLRVDNKSARDWDAEESITQNWSARALERQIDLVFYNYKLKCFLLIDLKLGKLTHQDVGQMDSYMRIYDQHKKDESDNPTIGLILCSYKSQAIAKYSVLTDSQQLFAAKYVQYLPTEEELKRELEREQALIQQQREKYNSND